MGTDKINIPIDYETLVEYISMMLESISVDDKRLLSSIPAIAQNVLGKKRALHRRTDKAKIIGHLIQSTWTEGFAEGVHVVTEELASSIKKNREIKKPPEEPKGSPEPSSKGKV